MDALDAALEDMVRAEHGEPDDSEDEDLDELPGLHYPLDYVLQTWFNFKEHGILPEAGGWNDQDWRLMGHDWPLVSARYHRMNRLLYPVEGQKGRDNGIRLPERGEGMDWRDLLK